MRRNKKLIKVRTECNCQGTGGRNAASKLYVVLIIDIKTKDSAGTIIPDKQFMLAAKLHEIERASLGNTHRGERGHGFDIPSAKNGR